MKTPIKDFKALVEELCIRDTISQSVKGQLRHALRQLEHAVAVKNQRLIVKRVDEMARILMSVLQEEE